MPDMSATGLGSIDISTIALVAVTYVLAGIVKGVTGLGIPIIGVALVAPVLGMQTAVAVLLVPSIVTNLWQAVVGGAFVRIVRRLWPMLITACIGIWFGSGILAAADGRFLIFFFGVFLIVYTTIALIKAKLPSPGMWETWLTPVMGAAGGVVFGMTGSFMVPGTLYVQSLGLARDQFVQALGIVFVTISSVMMGALAQRAMLSPEMVVLSVGALLPTILGMVLGQNLRRFLTEEQFTRVVLVVIMIAGFYMVGRSIWET